MAKLNEFGRTDCYHLLAGDLPRSFADNAVPGNIPADPNRRTLLIGLGGIGARTVDQIKGEMRKRLQPGWAHLVGFLAVDSDYGDLRELRHLTGQETVCTTRPGIQNAVHMGPMGWPLAWQSFVDAQEARQMPGFDHPGAGGRRQAGRMKLYYKAMGCPANDVEVVEKLRQTAFARLAPPHGGEFEVYVISSLCGGTGSGMLTDFPALIRDALGAHPANLHAVCYLPETVAALNPMQRALYESNAYAALKELDYYQNALSQPGHEELFPSNDPAASRRLTSDQGFFQQVLLMGAPGPHTDHALDDARDTVCRHILKLTEPHSGPMMPLPEVPEAPGAMTPEGFQRNYTAIGTARAELPRDILRAWQVGKLCERAGLRPGTPEQWAAMVAAGKIPPFLGLDQYESAAQLDRDARALLQPLVTFMNCYQAPVFSYVELFGHTPTWEEIRGGEADTAAHDALADQQIRMLTGTEAELRMRAQVTELFRQFRGAVMQYVMDKGPYAFVHLFEGRGLRGEDGGYPMGIEKMLVMLRDGLRPDTGTPCIWPTADVAEEKLRRAAGNIQNIQHPLFAHIMYPQRRQEQVDQWVNAYNFRANTRINEIRRRWMLGPDGILTRCFLEPACRLAEELTAFGRVLEDMTEIYRRHGVALEDFASFRDLGRESAVVNLGGLFPALCGRLRQEMERQLSLANPMALRQALVQSFFDEPERWTAVEESDLLRRGGNVELRSPQRPVSARKRFDGILDQNMPPVPDFTVRELGQMAANHGISGAALADGILDRLIPRCLRGLGPCAAGELHWELSYPRDVHMNDPALASALEHGAMMRQPDISFRVSLDGSTVSLRCVSQPFAAFRLAGVQNWQRCYAQRLQEPGSGLHSPGKEYPDILPLH